MKIGKMLGVVLAGCMLLSTPVMAAEQQPDNVVVSDDVTITFEGTGSYSKCMRMVTWMSVFRI